MANSRQIETPARRSGSIVPVQRQKNVKGAACSLLAGDCPHVRIQGSDGVFSNRKERKGRKETLFLILFALFAGFGVRCG